jgi:transposase InsO family protein
MKEHKGQYGVAKMAKTLGVSRSGYYAWEGRGQSKREKEDISLAAIVRGIFTEHMGRYGSPRVWEELKWKGWRVGRKRVERLMREQNLKARQRRKWVRTTDSGHNLAVSENILNRDFYALQPGEKWASDITYLRTDSGWLYLTVVLDLWDRKVIGWSMSKKPTAQQVCRALAMAFKNRPAKEGLIFHSDRGIQYCSEEFRKKLKRQCPLVRQSMSRKGNCWDNACAESFFKTLKGELETLDGKHSEVEVRQSVFLYIEAYYNRVRMHSVLDYVAPNMFNLEKVA